MNQKRKKHVGRIGVNHFYGSFEMSSMKGSRIYEFQSDYAFFSWVKPSSKIKKNPMQRKVKSKRNYFLNKTSLIKTTDIKMNHLKNMKWISWAETGEVDPFVYFLERDIVPHVTEGKIKELRIGNQLEFCKNFGEIVSRSESEQEKIAIYCVKDMGGYLKFYFDGGELTDLFYSIYRENIEDIEAVQKNIKDFAEKFKDSEPEEKQTNTYILVKNVRGLDLQKASVNLDLNVERNYGKDFLHHHDTIMDKITNKMKGLYLFYGCPGSGKTNYIRYLSKEIDRKFIFIPSCLFQSIDSPDFVSFLCDHKESVLVFEDAENVIQSREENSHNNSVSSILNLADGIVGDLLNLHMIITFNTSKERVDQALLRKGRLSYLHEFDKLSVEDSNYFLQDAGITVDKPHSLAELYNLEDETGVVEKEKKSMGFGM